MLHLDVVHASRDISETKDFLKGKDVTIDYAGNGDRRAFAARIAGAYFPNFYVSEIEYGVAAMLSAPAGTDRHLAWM